MDFTFNEEQTLIQDQVDQFVQKEYDWETRQSLSNSDLGFGESNWQKFAELGWLGISVSEDSGGFGGSAIESMLIMEAFGKGLVVEPFLETMIMAGSLIDDHGSDEQKSSILEPVSTNAVAMIVRLPPFSIFLAAPKNLLGFSNAFASTPPVRIFPEDACVEL